MHSATTQQLLFAFVRIDHEDFVFHLHHFVPGGVGFGRPCCRGRGGLQPEHRQHRDVNFQKDKSSCKESSEEAD
jgi:hypothetical protein